MFKILLLTFLNVVVVFPDMVPFLRNFDNPNYIRDRHRIIAKPELPPTYSDKFRAPYNPAWMDYCDPYHCNDYHKTVCGLNRRKMRFRYFQSVCHLILHNQCSTFRGFIKYDLIDVQHCAKYVMFLRSSCPRHCRDDEVAPVCGVSTTRGHIVLFENQCAFDRANCQNITLQEYEEAQMRYCENELRIASE